MVQHIQPLLITKTDARADHFQSLATPAEVANYDNEHLSQTYSNIGYVSTSFVSDDNTSGH